jgi:hypothetical protein
MNVETINVNTSKPQNIRVILHASQGLIIFDKPQIYNGLINGNT